MIETNQISINSDEIFRLKSKLNKARVALDKGFPFFTIFFLLFIDIILIVLAYTLVKEVGYFVYLFLLLTFIPTWLIFMITHRFFKTRPMTKKHFKLLYQILEKGEYSAIRIKSKCCHKYTEDNKDYYLFETESNQSLLLRLQDFDVETSEFPCNDFLIPPDYMFDIIGNKLIIKGEKLLCIENNKKIMRHTSVFKFLEHGQTCILNNN